MFGLERDFVSGVSGVLPGCPGLNREIARFRSAKHSLVLEISLRTQLLVIL